MGIGWASRLRNWISPISLVAVSGLTLSVLVWVAVAAWEDRGAEEEFKAAASTKLAQLQGGFNDYADVMRFYHGFIDGARGRVDGEGLEQRAAPILKEYAGLSALEWAPRVHGAERADFEAAARFDGLKGYKIFRLTASGQRVAAAEQGEYYPILYVTSDNARDLRTGYDLGSEPARRDILARARDSGRLAVSDVLPPLMGRDEQQILAAQAVYAGGSARWPSVAARRLNLLGFTVGVFRLKEMVDGTLKRLTQTRGYHTYIYRAQAAADELPLCVHTSLRAKVPAPPMAFGILKRHLNVSGQVSFGNRSWLAVVVPMRDPRPGLGGLQALGAFLLCLILSSLAAAYTHELQRRRQRELLLVRELGESKQWLSTIHNSVNDGIFLTTVDTGVFIDVNRAGCEMFGYAPGELVGADIARLSSGVAPYTQADALQSLVRARSGGASKFEWHARRKDGSLFWVEISLRVASIRTREFGFAVVRDITENRQAREQIVRMSRHDVLTGLPNRGVFVENLERTIAAARRRSCNLAVLYLDLDHFKDVNDTLGHPAGDLLLRAVADRLTECIRATDMVARFGGDEFAVLVSGIDEPAERPVVSGGLGDTASDSPGISGAATTAAGIANKILEAVSKPYAIQGNEVHSGASVGIAVYGPESADAETILTHADEALYRAKSEGRGTYRFFTDAMDSEVHARVEMNRELREAIASDQLFFMYQPQVEIATGRIVGLEALLHWHHPRRGDLDPGVFLAVAEANGLIVSLGRWAVHEACRQVRQWCDAGIAPLSVAVRVSGLQLKTPHELEQTVARALTEFALPAQLIELELSESVLMQASLQHNDPLQSLRDLGVRLAIAEFGTGYSSLDYLRRRPVDRIKIARNFIAETGTTPGSDVVVKAALGLARELGVQSVAEGVESTAQIALLQAWGCPIAQGRYFAKPLNVAEVTGLLRVGMITPPGRDPVASALEGRRNRSDVDSIRENSPAAKSCSKRRAGQGWQRS